MSIAKGYVSTRDGQVHYRRAGADGPALVLLHESPLSSRAFEPVLPALGRAMRAVAFDTPGYGQSDAPAQPPPLADYGRRLLAAVDAMGLAQFAIAGIHTGAAIALVIAADLAPDRVTHLVLSGVPLLSGDQRRAFRQNLLQPKIASDGAHLGQLWVARRQAWGAATPDALVQFGTTELLTVYPRYLWALEAVFAEDCGPRLAKLRCPVAIINGEHDALAGADRDAAARLAGCELKILPDVAGQLPLRIPDIYADHVRRFVCGGA